MNLDYMNTLTALVRLGSFSAVAKEQGITQPAISFQIQKLEQDLNVKLLNRTSRKISLTDAGKRVVKYAENVEIDYQRLLRDLEIIREDLVGELRIVSASTPGEYIVPTFLGRYLASHRGITSKVDVKSSQEVISDIVNGHYDVGFCSDLPPKRKDLEFFKVGSDRIKLIVHPSHPFAKLNSITFSMIENEPVISREPSSGTRHSLEHMIKNAGYNYDLLNERLVLSSSHAIITAVEAGIGIGFVSSLALLNSKNAGAINTIKISDLDLTRDFYCIYAKSSINSRLVKEFIKFIEDNINIEE